MVQSAAQVVMLADGDEVGDLAFALRGGVIRPDYADALWHELLRCLPWLADEPGAGVHPIGGVSEGEGELYLSGRSRLILRLSVDRHPAARTLIGQNLRLGSEVAVGQPTLRRLVPSAVLYSAFVSCGPAEESEFMRVCREELAGLGFGNPRLICGKARRGAPVTGEPGELGGFSLMVHGLNADDSLRLQRTGLGGQRHRGCGIFVQHKSIVAVDDV